MKSPMAAVYTAAVSEARRLWPAGPRDHCPGEGCSPVLRWVRQRAMVRVRICC